MCFRLKGATEDVRLAHESAASVSYYLALMRGAARSFPVFFFSLRVVEGFSVGIAVLGAALFLIWFVRKCRNSFRISVIILSSPIAALAALFIGLQVLFLGCESHSVPLYSPSHNELVRVSTIDGGALGGSSALELLTHHGLSSTYIYRGGWNSVDIGKDVRWLDEDHIIIQYEPYQFSDCTSTRSVKVRCFEKKPLVPTGTLSSPNGSAVAELHTAKDGTYQGTDAVILTGKIGYAFVYVGDPGSVVWIKTRWVSDHELEISTKSTPKACANQIGIIVVCVPYAAK